MLTDVYIFYIFVYTYTCNDMRSVMLQINEYDDDGGPVCSATSKTEDVAYRIILLLLYKCFSCTLYINILNL